MSNIEARTNAELEDTAAVVIGRIVLVLSRLEFNLGLYMRNAVAGSDPEGANALISRLSFKSKLDALQELVNHKFASQPAASAALRHWLQEMERFRPRRNSFVHGRWAFLSHSQEIVNVAPGLPNGKPQREVRYSVADLQLALDQAERLATEFRDWSRTWPL